MQTNTIITNSIPSYRHNFTTLTTAQNTSTLNFADFTQTSAISDSTSSPVNNINTTTELSSTSVKSYDTDRLLSAFGNFTDGSSYHFEYSLDSTDENPIVNVFYTDKNGDYFEETINLNDVDPTNATYTEFTALYAHLGKDDSTGLHAGSLFDLPDVICVDDVNFSTENNDTKMNYMEILQNRANYFLSSSFEENRQVGLFLNSMYSKFEQFLNQDTGADSWFKL